MVQALGLELLQRQDNIARATATVDEVRLAAVASGKHEAPDIFPEYFPHDAMEMTEDTPEDIFVDPESNFDLSGIEWQSPGDLAEEELRMLEAFLSDPTITLSGEDIDDEHEAWH